MSKITNDGLTRSLWHRMLYSCTDMATVGVKGLTLPVIDWWMSSAAGKIDSSLSDGGDDDEGQVEERRQDATREGKRRVLRTGQTTSASAGHHQPAGQGVHHTTNHQLLEDESRLPWRSVLACFSYFRSLSRVRIAKLAVNRLLCDGIVCCISSNNQSKSRNNVRYYYYN